MANIWLLVKNNSGILTPVGLEDSEARARDLAYDGDFYLIPIQLGKVYDSIVDIGIVGTVSFQNTSIKTIVNAVKNAVQNINNRLDSHDTQLANIISQGQALNQLVQDIDARVTALEGST